MSFDQAILIVVLILAAAVGGAMLAIAVHRMRRAPEVSDDSGDVAETEQKNSTERFAACLAIGIGAGVAIGAAMGNVAFGIPIGVAIGIALGAGKGMTC